jgi:hypothetical protein
MRKPGQFVWPLMLLVGGIAWGAAALPPGAGPGDEAALGEALHWLDTPPRFDADYNYEMTVQIRLLLFWIGKDDVGGGYVKLGKAAADPNLEFVQLLFGSDPAKTHGINRWGGGTEVVNLGERGAMGSSVFMGFMKSSKGESVGAMQRELANEKSGGQHRFEAIISRVDPGRAISTTVPFSSGRDFDFRDLDPAEQLVRDRLKAGDERKFHALERPALGCNRGRGFLSTVLELNDRALERPSAPVTLCYVYNSNQYTLTLEKTRAIPQKAVHYTLRDTKQTIDQTYRNLVEAQFEISNPAGKKTNFNILLGTDGALRGAPVQIDYQPNWWFQITLNLKPGAQTVAAGR